MSIYVPVRYVNNNCYVRQDLLIYLHNYYTPKSAIDFHLYVLPIYNTLARKPPTSVVGMNRQKAYLKVGYINSCW